MWRSKRKPKEIVWQPDKLIRTPAQLQSPPATAHTRHLLLIMVTIIGVLGLLVLVVWLVASGLLNHNFQSPPNPELSFVAQKLPVNSVDQARAEDLARRYMNALLTRQYNTMWSLLNPEKRSQWPNQKVFATFMQVRFQHYTLQNFTTGNANILTYWVNPETMTTYKSVIELPISLHFHPDQVLQRQPLLPPEDLQPDRVFRNLPFIIQTTGPHGLATQWSILEGGPADLEAPILPPLKPLNPAIRVPILMYHHVSNLPQTNQLDLSLTVTPARFEAQMNYLKARGYHTITFNQMFDALYYNGPLPPHPLILTFDDGYEDVYHFALPILQSHGFSGMFYIITGKVGQPDYMSWPEVQNLLTAGMQIGSHTVHHISLAWIVIGDPKLTQEELQQSQAALQMRLDIPIQQFCYPSGEPYRNGTLLMQQRIAAMLAADGYVGATTDPGRTGIIQDGATPFALLRIRVDGRESLGTFTGIMDSILPLLTPTSTK